MLKELLGYSTLMHARARICGYNVMGISAGLCVRNPILMTMYKYDLNPPQIRYDQKRLKRVGTKM